MSLCWNALLSVSCIACVSATITAASAPAGISTRSSWTIRVRTGSMSSHAVGGSRITKMTDVFHATSCVVLGQLMRHLVRRFGNTVRVVVDISCSTCNMDNNVHNIFTG